MNEPLAVREAPASYLVGLASQRVRPGYKQTEVGVIPVDWEVKPIKAVCKLINGRGFKPFEWLKTGLPIIRIQNLNGSDDFNFYQGAYDKKLEVEYGQLLFAWSGSRGTSFGPHVWTGHRGLLNYHTWKVQVYESEIDKGFFLYALRQLTSFIEDNAHGASALVHTQKWEMEGFEFPLPPTKAEQEAIAEALSDTDALIESLEQLIAKKRHFKQGAMQELLTGKKRLPGFNGEWEVKRLGDVAEIVMGQSPSSSNYNEKGLGLPLIQGNADIANRKTISRIFTTEITKRGKCGDILMSVRAPVGEISRAVFDVCLGRGVCAVRYSNDFMYHYLISQEPSWAKLSKGSTFDSVNSADVKALEVCLPSDVEEQTAIATILFDMDTEIAALETRLTKTRELKQGMMHNLLTGKIRLV
jgi:type I restriction enzyme S subunit